MKNTRMSKFKCAAALQALTVMGAGLAAVTAVPAIAQDYTSGAINGTVTDESGSPIAGATVTLTSPSTGVSRTATTTASGAYRFIGLTAGAYDVVVEAEGKPSYTAEAVPVQSSQTASLDVVLTSGGSEIVVTGSTVVADFQGTTTGVNIDVSELVKTTPIGRDLTSLILLAPGTSQGDDGFGNLASIGGSSVAENAYYINGLNITNFDNYLGSGRVPFEFYRSVEVKSGGYPAEYGRATGGIINAVSKSGSNDFMAAMHLNYTPDWLRSNSKNLVNCDSTGACENLTNRGKDRASSYSAILEAGLPIIKDRLFVYGLVEFREDKSTVINRATGLAAQRTNNDPFYAVKVDAYPIDGQHLEFTLFDSRNTTRRSDLTYTENNGAISIGAAQGISDFNSGGINFVGKYTGTFTDWLTVSAAYGRNRDRFETIGVDEGSQAFFFQNASGAPVNGVGQAGLFTGQTATSRDFPYTTEREFFRGDVDVFVSLFGEHHFRAGFDVENNDLNHFSVRNGGDVLFNAGFLSPEAYNANQGSAGAAIILRAGGVFEVNYFNGGGAFGAQNKSFYLQDEWKVTDRLTLNLGVRRDDFKLDKPDGSQYVDLPENYAPRFGFTYDIGADKEGKFFGSYGQYFLPVASNTAFRQAGAEFFIRERFNYDPTAPFDANGLPVPISQVTGLAAYQATCPFGLTTFSSGVNCNVTGDGSVKPTSTTLSQDLKATRETEWILGYKHRFNDITVGISYTHRNLDISAEDVAVDAAVLAYCDANGLVGCEDTWTGFHQYVITNPGKDATFNLDGQDGRVVTLSAEDLRYPKPKRTYDAVELSIDKAWDGNWSVGGSYTWSKSKGNSEGFVQSDFEQDDAGITQDFDQPGFTENASGYLPNHRLHRFKLYGAVALSDEFTIGTNIRVDSPRRLSCFGFNPNPNYFDPNGDPYSDFGNAYGAASHFCGTGPLDANGEQQSAPAVRGEGFKTDWIGTIDISGRYNVKFGEHTLTFRADVFNLLNSQGIQGRNEIGDLDIGVNGDAVIPNPNYGNVSSYQTPRSVRLGLDISF